MTGVQTCALPIFCLSFLSEDEKRLSMSYSDVAKILGINTHTIDFTLSIDENYYSSNVSILEEQDFKYNKPNKKLISLTKVFLTKEQFLQNTKSLTGLTVLQDTKMELAVKNIHEKNGKILFLLKNAELTGYIFKKDGSSLVFLGRRSGPGGVAATNNDPAAYYQSQNSAAGILFKISNTKLVRCSLNVKEISSTFGRSIDCTNAN